MLVLTSNSVATKKGKMDGTIEVTHKANPDFAAIKFDDENTIKQIVKPDIRIGKKYFLIKLILFASFFFIYSINIKIYVDLERIVLK